jgi:hypothetical protein
MPISRAAWLEAVTEYSTTQNYPLGTEREVPSDGDGTSATSGGKLYRYVLNGEASTAFAAGNLIQRKAATASAGTGIVCVTTDVWAGKLLGVASSAIPAGSYGWVQIKGYNSAVVTGGAVVAGAAIGSEGGATAGAVYTVDPTASATKLGAAFAYALTDDSGTQGFVMLNID